jgi:colanic acid/amylovoran biosynthesis glycosyltransferase
MRKVLIYRNELLPISETFIRGQAAALKTFEPIFIGLRRYTAGFPLPDSSVVFSQSDSYVARGSGLLYKLGGWAPRFHARARAAGASLIHAHFAVDGVNALALAAATELPLMTTLHGIDVTTKESLYRQSVIGRIYLSKRQKLWQRASVFTCASDFLRKSAIEAGFPEEKLRVHYIGIDLSFFQPSTLSGPRTTVLFVARLVEKKGCKYLIRAMQEVQDRFPLANLVIIGDGPERASLEALAKELGVRCEFRGAQPSAAVRQELATARVFCVPSVTASTGDSEGLGIVFAEAQAMGVPVVSSLHGGIPEVVRQQETGLLAPEQDHRKLAEHIGRFFADDQFWTDCSKRAVAWVHERFDIGKQTRELESIYETVIAKGVPTRGRT